MLVLSRKTDEEVVIEVGGERVVVMVVTQRDAHGNTRLGFTAPRQVKIHRREVWEQMQRDAWERESAGLPSSAAPAPVPQPGKEAS